MYNFCLDKIGKRISGWANHLLSFTGKVLLIQHVLQSITTYHMIYTSTPTSTIQQINHLFKDFLWGFDRETGRRKMPLVAWKKLTQPWDRGGLGFMDCKIHVNALLSKWVSKALIEPSIEWAQIFLALLVEFTWEQCHVFNRAHLLP